MSARYAPLPFPRAPRGRPERRGPRGGGRARGMRMRLVSAFAGAFAGVSAALISRPALCRAGSTGALEPRFEAVASRLTALEALERPSRGVVTMAQPEDEPSSTARVIDGKAIAQEIREEIREFTEELVREHGVTPGLAVVLVGNRTDSSTYVRMKKKAAAEVGFYSVDKEFPESVGQEELLACIRALNDDPKVHGILTAILTARHPTPSAHHNPHPSLGQLLASSCGCRCPATHANPAP